VSIYYPSRPVAGSPQGSRPAPPTKTLYGRGDRHRFRGPWPAQGLAEAIELLFDDGSDSPYALHLSPQQIDRVPPDSESGREVRVTVWTEGPTCTLDLPGRYRRSARLPDLSPWRVN